MLQDGKHRKLLKHLNTPGVAHYLTFSTYKRHPFLKSDLPCQWLAESINRSREKHKFDLWAYVFMPDHVHLLIFPRNEDYDMGKILGSIKIPVSRKAIQYWKEHHLEMIEKVTIRLGTRTIRRFWEAGGGFDREIYKLKTCRNSAEYIHNNPVVKGFCQSALDWKWSSAGYYAGKPNQPIEIDGTMPVLRG
jgi:putative transposase